MEVDGVRWRMFGGGRSEVENDWQLVWTVNIREKAAEWQNRAE